MKVVNINEIFALLESSDSGSDLEDVILLEVLNENPNENLVFRIGNCACNTTSS